MRRYSCGVAGCSSSTDFLRSLYRGGDIRACLGRRYICRATDLRETLRKEPPEVCERDYLVSASNIHVADTRFVSREIQLRHFPKPFRDIGISTSSWTDFWPRRFFLLRPLCGVRSNTPSEQSAASKTSVPLSRDGSRSRSVSVNSERSS